jgi:hypothetical protein
MPMTKSGNDCNPRLIGIVLKIGLENNEMDIAITPKNMKIITVR